MSSTTSEHVRLVTDQQGRLLLINALPGKTARETTWTCLWTLGHRTIRGLAGTCVHDGLSGRDRQVVHAVKARIFDAAPSMPAPALASAVRTFLMKDPPDPKSTILVERFREACGTATLRAVALCIDPKSLASLDVRFGPDAVDRTFEAAPLLASLVFHPGSDGLGVEVGDAFHAVASGEGLPEALVVLARRLDARPDFDLLGDPFAEADENLGEDEADDFDLIDDFEDRLRRGADPENLHAGAPDGIRVATLPDLPQGDPDACAALMARLGRTLVPVAVAPVLVRETAWIPRDWLPADADEAVCCAEILSLAVEIARESGGALSPRTLVAPAKGRWGAFARQLGRGNPSFAVGYLPAAPARERIGKPARNSDLVIGVRDMVRRFVNQLARPAAAWGTDGAVGPVEGRRDLHLNAWRILFRDKGLAAILQASADWHARHMEIDRLVRTLSDGRQWDRPFPDFTAGNGMVATPLLSAQELGEEGAALLHCVGDYADSCHSGLSVIVSLRKRVDGIEMRSSTIELEWEGFPRGSFPPGWRPGIVQHRGRLNGNPGSEDMEAAGELMEWIADGHAFRKGGGGRNGSRGGGRSPLLATLEHRLNAAAERISPPDPDDTPRRRQTHADIDGHRLATQCGYDWREAEQVGLALDAWGPFLPRDLRASVPILLAALGVERTAKAPPAMLPVQRVDGMAAVGLHGVIRAQLRLAKALGIVAFRSVRRAGWRTWLSLASMLVAFLCAGSAVSWLADGPQAAPRRTSGFDLADRLDRLVERSPVPCPTAGSVPGSHDAAPQGTGGTCASLGPLRVRRADRILGARSYHVSYAVEGMPPLRIVDVYGEDDRWQQDSLRGFVTGKLDEDGISSGLPQEVGPPMFPTPATTEPPAPSREPAPVRR